ncbi:unnamed protein product [Vitrella brassicaformis CCMP3155]|uniref:3'-5' exonuclease domain-containing protein n=1 Tax=Vitrella brassicaformis (strain CCMP3155) TaxID=1169540 RepID=A0A0G4EGJ2_VITBC|nr:unnamed protein product [Vitrella brassicaformis CCMP3155]|eukprot:CEL95361.1 unnamed protein product [Vitrella brassicaformis CCMP3155]
MSTAAPSSDPPSAAESCSSPSPQPASPDLASSGAADQRKATGVVNLKLTPELEERYGSTKREIHLIDSRDACEDCLPELISAPAIAVDCEGVNLGRFGRLCLIQIAAGDRVFLFDCLKEGIMNTLAPVLSHANIVKVMHDCREDSSALHNQYGIQLQNVFDTQVAHFALLDQDGFAPYQISLNDLLLKALKLSNRRKSPITAKMVRDPNVWYYRPVSRDLIEYAVQDVLHLLPLRQRLCEMLDDLHGYGVIRRSRNWVNYAHLNPHLKAPNDIEQKGLKVQAMCVAAHSTSMYFKLNCDRQGVVSRPDTLQRFKDVKIGDVAECFVTNWNLTGNIVFLDRYEPSLSHVTPNTRVKYEFKSDLEPQPEEQPDRPVAYSSLYIVTRMAEKQAEIDFYKDEKNLRQRMAEQAGQLGAPPIKLADPDPAKTKRITQTVEEYQAERRKQIEEERRRLKEARDDPFYDPLRQNLYGDTFWRSFYGLAGKYNPHDDRPPSHMYQIMMFVTPVLTPFLMLMFVAFTADSLTYPSEVVCRRTSY